MTPGSPTEAPPDAVAPSPAAPEKFPAKSDPPGAWWLRLAAALFAGCLWFLACPDFDYWPLAWVAMVPMFWAVERAHTPRQAFFYAWMCGVVGNGGGFYWVVELLRRFAFMPLVAALGVFLLMASYQGLVFGFTGLAIKHVRRRHPKVPYALVGPLALVAFEHAMPQVFPFYVAITQAWQPRAIQLAELAGPLGVSALLLTSSGALFDLLVLRRRRPGAIGLAVVAAGLLFGVVRVAQVRAARERAPEVRVGVVQPNVSFNTHGVDHQNYAEDQLRDLHERSRDLESRGAELIVWPESAYPYPVSRARTRDYAATSQTRLRDGFTAPLVFGALTAEPDGRRGYYNSMISTDREGNFTGRFDKMFLMIFGEYTPGRDTFDFIDRWMPSTAGQLARGAQVTTLPFRHTDGVTYRLGPMICYEDIVPAFGRQLARLHPHLLVNATNDAWFGDTSEPWEHLALSVFRAVEMRTDLVRAVNTGVSAYVDSTGRVYHRTYAVDPTLHPRPAEGAIAPMRLVEGGHTVYAVLGDWLGYLAAGALAWWLFVSRWVRKGAPATSKKEPA